MRAFKAVGGHAVFRGPRRRGLRLGRRGQPLRRLRPVLRRLHPGPRPPQGGRGDTPGGRRGDDVRGAYPSEVELAEEICARVPGCDKVRLVSSGTEAAMSAVRAGPGGHRAGPGGAFRRLLPRAQRRPAGGRGQRGGHAGAAGLGRRPARRGGRNPRRPLQRRARTGHRRGRCHRRADRGQHGPGPARARASWRACARPATGPAPCSFSTK